MEHDDIEKAELSRLSLVCALDYVNVGVIVIVIKKKEPLNVSGLLLSYFSISRLASHKVNFL